MKEDPTNRVAYLIEHMIPEDLDEFEASPVWEYILLKIGLAQKQYEIVRDNPALDINVRLDAIGRISGHTEQKTELEMLRAALADKASHERALREEKDRGTLDPLVEVLKRSQRGE